MIPPSSLIAFATDHAIEKKIAKRVSCSRYKKLLQPLTRTFYVPGSSTTNILVPPFAVGLRSEPTTTLTLRDLTGAVLGSTTGASTSILPANVYSIDVASTIDTRIVFDLSL